MSSFFKNKFSPKKTPARKASISLTSKDFSPKDIERELGPDVGPIRLQLSDQELIFDGGIWVPELERTSGIYKENEKLKNEIHKLEEENNLLKLKLELLIDMLTETTAVSQLHQGELENLKNKISHKKRSGT